MVLRAIASARRAAGSDVGSDIHAAGRRSSSAARLQRRAEKAVTSRCIQVNRFGLVAHGCVAEAAANALRACAACCMHSAAAGRMCWLQPSQRNR